MYMRSYLKDLWIAAPLGTWNDGMLEYRVF